MSNEQTAVLLQGIADRIKSEKAKAWELIRKEAPDLIVEKKGFFGPYESCEALDGLTDYESEIKETISTLVQEK